MEYENNIAKLNQQEKKDIWVKWKNAGSWDNFLESVTAQKIVGGKTTVIKFDNQEIDNYETKYIEPISGIDNFFEEKSVVFNREHKTSPRINSGYFIPRNYWNWCLQEMQSDPKFVHPFKNKFKDEDERMRQFAKIRISLENLATKFNPHKEAKDAYLEKQKLCQAEIEEKKAKIMQEVRKEMEV